MDRRTAEGPLLIELGGRLIEYRFARRRRRTLGITVDAEGLKVAAPLRAPWRDIEAFLREKERWILAKLAEWSRVPRARLLRGESGELLPLHGTPVELEVRQGRRAVSHCGAKLLVSAPPVRVLPTLLAWLKARALEALLPRTAHFAAQLDLAVPRVTLSHARTQWGVCTAEGAIRLSWRLVHIDPGLADYVVAHEVAHLVELNHSRRFWDVVAGLYPGWYQARERLELAGASLPIIRGGT
jgi:predicted metal-dependent hydrolase